MADPLSNLSKEPKISNKHILKGFPDVYRGYRKRLVAGNVFIIVSEKKHIGCCWSAVKCIIRQLG